MSYDAKMDLLCIATGEQMHERAPHVSLSTLPSPSCNIDRLRARRMRMIVSTYYMPCWVIMRSVFGFLSKSIFRMSGSGQSILPKTYRLACPRSLERFEYTPILATLVSSCFVRSFHDSFCECMLYVKPGCFSGRSKSGVLDPFRAFSVRQLDL